MLPLTPDGPPWTFDFVALLHGGCYEDPDDRLLTCVAQDPDGARMLGALDRVVGLLRLLGHRQ
ncbi:MAG: hypothetical protein WAW17_30285 [Rhodococcus sp. (in: high G+C Gram-positive bacteria)]|uniref:hypothetical protein n=1 Tax=Rhodococcus sp. TaxID=1831 RepID=UPI003BAFC5D3